MDAQQAARRSVCQPFAEVNDLGLDVERSQRLREVPCIRTLASLYPGTGTLLHVHLHSYLCSYHRVNSICRRCSLGDMDNLLDVGSTASARRSGREVWKILTASFRILCIKCSIL